MDNGLTGPKKDFESEKKAGHGKSAGAAAGGGKR